MSHCHIKSQKPFPISRGYKTGGYKLDLCPVLLYKLEILEEWAACNCALYDMCILYYV